VLVRLIIADAEEIFVSSTAWHKREVFSTVRSRSSVTLGWMKVFFVVVVAEM